MSQAAVVHPARRRRFRFALKPGRALLYALLGLWAAITTYPFLWVVLASLKSTFELYQNPFGLPKVLQFKNYVTAWVQASMGRLSLNSLTVALVSVVFAMILASTCAFALSRFNFRLKGLVWAYIFMGFLMPDTVRLVPLAVFTRRVGIYDTLLGLILVYSVHGLPWYVFFLSSFMGSIPRELEEAAVMDGANMWQVFRHVILPVSQPAIATMATFHVLYCWNEFMLALLLTSSQNTRTLPVGVSFLTGTFYTNECAIAAALVISFLPAVIFFLLLQRYVVKGMTAGALASF